MTTPRDPRAYHDHWFTLISKVADEGVIVDLPAKDMSTKKAISFEWYGFKRALASDPMFEELSRKAQQIRLSFKVRGKLRFHTTQNGDIAKALTNVFGEALSPAPVTDTPQIAENDFVESDQDTVVLMSKYLK